MGDEMLGYIENLIDIMQRLYLTDDGELRDSLIRGNSTPVSMRKKGKKVLISSSSGGKNIFDFPLYLYHMKLCKETLHNTGCGRSKQRGKSNEWISALRQKVDNGLWQVMDGMAKSETLKKFIESSVELDDLTQNANYMLLSFSGKQKTKLVNALNSIKFSGSDITPVANASQYLIDWASQLGRFEDSEGGKPTSMLRFAFQPLGSRKEYKEYWTNTTGQINRIHEWHTNLEYFSVDKATWTDKIRSWELDFTKLVIDVNKYRQSKGLPVTEEFMILVAHDIFGGTEYGTRSDPADDLFIMRCVVYCDMLTTDMLNSYKKRAVQARRCKGSVSNIYEENEPDSYYMEMVLAYLLLRAMNLDACTATPKLDAAELTKQVMGAMKESLASVVNNLDGESKTKLAVSDDTKRNKIAHVTVSYLMTFIVLYMQTCRSR